MENRHVLSILVRNQSGVLSRITGLFSRRGYNIDSLTVGVTEDPNLSRMTVCVHTDDETVVQIKNQVRKLYDVLKVEELSPSDAVIREIVMIKIKASSDDRAEVIGICDIFRANIVDVAPESLVAQITGDEAKLDAFVSMLEPFGIKEIVRTGLTALKRGPEELKNIKQ
ncbi:MAG: acetolactate synthase small subunit [Acholeplasmatales bacterium]|nr:acetolactate synthase small subunit [Acholeplasmatales bacterium]